MSNPALQPFLDEGFVTDIIRPIGTGKEAEVFLCRAAPHRTGGEMLVVAKALRERTQRNFRNNARYLEGRFRKVTSEVRAMQKNERVGREMAHGAWIAHEWETLRALHAAGADVPRPIARASGALLLEHIGEGETPAPQLRQVRLDADDAARTFERLLWNVGLFLLHNVVHADLSAYNVLWHGDRATVIDFPQAIDPRFHTSARELLERDIRNLCSFFARLGIERDPDPIADDLWTGFEHADLWIEPG
jgi:RIO kinase 1